MTSAADADHLVEAWRLRDLGALRCRLTRTPNGIAWSDVRGVDVTRGTGALGSTATFNNAFPGYASASWAFYLNANQLPARRRLPARALPGRAPSASCSSRRATSTRIYARLTVR